jgi:hypothetical protein
VTKQFSVSLNLEGYIACWSVSCEPGEDTMLACVSYWCMMCLDFLLLAFNKKNSVTLQLISIEILILQKKFGIVRRDLHICHSFQRPVET